MTTPEKKQELVDSVQDHVISLNPDTGKERGRAEGVHRYVCPSVVAHEGIVNALGGGSTSRAVKASGRPYDRLQVGGAATLGGTLQFSTLAGYEPNSGDRFKIMTFASSVGDFAADVCNGTGRTLTDSIGPTGFTIKAS